MLLLSRFHLNSPATDTNQLPVVKQRESQGCVAQEPFSAPLTRTGVGQGLAEGTIPPVPPALDLALAKKMAAWISS